MPHKADTTGICQCGDRKKLIRLIRWISSTLLSAFPKMYWSGILENLKSGNLSRWSKWYILKTGILRNSICGSVSEVTKVIPKTEIESA